jgi:hypothetical protein
MAPSSRNWTNGKTPFKVLYRQYGFCKKHPEFSVKHYKYWQSDVKEFMRMK